MPGLPSWRCRRCECSIWDPLWGCLNRAVAEQISGRNCWADTGRWCLYGGWGTLTQWKSYPSHWPMLVIQLNMILLWVWWSLKDWNSLQIRHSQANIWNWNTLGMSSEWQKKTLKRISSKTEPWGTPESTTVVSKTMPSFKKISCNTALRRWTTSGQKHQYPCAWVYGGAYDNWHGMRESEESTYQWAHL